MPSMINNSIWLEHPKYPDYRISPEGNVLSLKSRGRLLKHRIKRDGYSGVALLQNGRYEHKQIHRLVAEVFLNKPASTYQVNHKNGIKTDNRLDNLEWVTVRQNLVHSIQVLNRSYEHRRGMKSNFAKLSCHQVTEIKNVLQTKQKHGFIVKLAKKYNVSHATISMIKSGKIWAHIKA